MAPAKRKANVSIGSYTSESNKRLSRADREKFICKRKLDELEQTEALASNDRFSSQEKQCLLDAYNKCGFQVFQDMKLLHEFLPNRREIDLIGLLDRLRTKLIANQKETCDGDETGESAHRDEQPDVDHIREWQRLCQSLMGSFARDGKVNLDDVLADSLSLAANELEIQYNKHQVVVEDNCERGCNAQLNYPRLLKCFSYLLAGKFPDSMSPADARISIKLFEHVNSMADTIDLGGSLSSLLDGSWLEDTFKNSKMRQEWAMKGIEDWNKLAKESLTPRDIEKNHSIEALCLELPKIKRITEVLNPLRVNESLVSGLMDL